MERSIFSIGLFIGAVAVRFGYDCGCRTAELLAINDRSLPFQDSTKELGSRLYTKQVVHSPSFVLYAVKTKGFGVQFVMSSDQIFWSSEER
uniref:Uncharacterized protein n=1 Tax=Nelumbo nucifera TaxID=4432 RepID=A0A822ZFI6_NELNU|nr:TPA_asm: hypothetical protein HUJ06_014701 [Nelumbo nucifera]